MAQFVCVCLCVCAGVCVCVCALVWCVCGMCGCWFGVFELDASCVSVMFESAWRLKVDVQV